MCCCWMLFDDAFMRRTTFQPTPSSSLVSHAGGLPLRLQHFVVVQIPVQSNESNQIESNRIDQLMQRATTILWTVLLYVSVHTIFPKY
jgi:hypothetical protein